MTAEPDQDVGRLTRYRTGTIGDSHVRGRVEPVGETPKKKRIIIKGPRPGDDPSDPSDPSDPKNPMRES